MASLPASNSHPEPHRREASDERERRWMAAVRSGDTMAFAEAFDALYPAVRVFLYRFTQSVAIAEELAQDVFVAWWDERERLDIRASLRTFLFAAARNRALNHVRHEEVARRWVDGVVAEGDRVRDDADWAAREAEVAEAVADALRTLPPRMRQIFLMHRAKSLSYAEIAARLGVTVKTVDTHIARAVKALKARLRVFRA